MLALATLLLLTAPTAEAKGKPGRKSKKTEAAAEKADTTKKEKKGYEELLKGAVTDKGMFDVHRKGTDFLFEIPDSLMGRDILIVNKISGVPYALNDAGVNKGMGYGEKIVRFRKDTLYKKVWVMTYDPRITSPEGDRITRSVRDNYRETAIEQFPIDAYGKDSASVVIKVNKVFDGSEKSFNNVFGSIGLPGSPKKDLSKIESVKSFPENIIVKSLLSTSHTEEGTTIPLTVEITSNLVLLAREPMRPRFSDDRVGYFEIGHLYFNDEQQKAEERAFINRWRLEPKPEDVERYKKGELVEKADRVVDRPGDPARMGSLHQERHRRVAGGLRGRRLQERHRSTGGHPRRPGVRHRRRALLGGDLRRLGDGQRHGPFGDRPPERRDHRGRHHLVAQRDEHSPRLDPPPDRRRGPRSARQHAADGGDGQCRALRLVARAGAQPRTEAQFRGFVLRAGGFAPLEELHRNERDGQFDHGLRPLQLRGPARGRHHATDAQDRNLRQTRHQLGLPLARRAGPARSCRRSTPGCASTRTIPNTGTANSRAKASTPGHSRKT